MANTAGYDPFGLNRKLKLEEKYAIPKTYFNHQERAVDHLAKRSTKAFFDLKQGNMANGAVQYRGGLVWHGTGSGKTVTGLGILLQYLKIGEILEKKGIPAPYLCVVTTIANERQNGMNTYLRNLMRYHPEYALELAREQHHMIASNQTIKIFEALKKVFTKRVKFFTYQKFASCLGLFGKGNIQQDEVCNEMRTPVEVPNGKRKIPQYLHRGMVVILDESHELIKANMDDLKEVKNGKPIKNQYQSILQTKKMVLKNVKNPFLHVYCLTATPGTSIREYVDTLNLVRPANMPKLDETSVFNHEIRKFVHRVDLSGNPNYFASTVKERREVPICKEHYLLTLGFIRKHESQEKKHIESLRTGKKTTSKSAQLVYRYFHREAYMAEARRMENWIRHSPNNEFNYYGVKMFEKVEKQPMVQTKKGVRVPKPKAPRRVASAKITEYIAQVYYRRMRRMVSTRDGMVRLKKLFPDQKALLKLDRSMTVVVTPKLFRVAYYIANVKGKQFVYSNDPVSNKIIATMISIMYGFEDVTTRVLDLRLQYRDPNSNNTNAPNGNTHAYRRYILSDDPKGKGIETFQAFMSGLNMEKEGARRIPEDPSETKFRRNAHGEMCKIIFVTGELYTGVDINALRGVHLLNPFASKVSDMQARGRAARSKGHAFLNVANRNAKIYEYISSVDKFYDKKPSIGDVLKPLRADKKTYTGFMAAYQWILGRSKIRGAVRVSGKNVMRLDDTTQILPTADSIVERQKKFDVDTERLEAFERKLKRHVIKTESTKK